MYRFASRAVCGMALFLGLASALFARWHTVEVDHITMMDFTVYTFEAPATGLKIRVVVDGGCPWHSRVQDGWLMFTGGGRLPEDNIQLVWESDPNHSCQVVNYQALD